MHELSLCGAIYDIADRAAVGREVSVIHLQVGRLRQVIPDTLTYCWGMVSEDTALAGSRLDVDYRPVTLRCQQCAEDTTLSKDLLLLCGTCGGSDVTVTSGEELLVTSLDLTEV
jgi:hydrogenase nickel incorporation protein HypA/HybF